MKDRYENYRGPSRGNMRKPRLGTVLLLLWGLFLTAAVYGYLEWLQPSRLASTVSRVLESKLNVQSRIGEVSFSLLPLPTIHATDLALLRGSVDDLELHVRKAEIRISYSSLLRLKPVIHSLSLESPTLDISSAILQKALAEKTEPKEKERPLPSLPSGITGVRLHVENGVIRVTGAEGKDHLLCTGLNASARLPGLIPGSLELSADDIRYTNVSGLEVSAAESHISLSSLRRTHRNVWRGNVLVSSALQLGALDAVMGHEISAPYRYFPMPEPLRVSLTGGFSLAPEKEHYEVRGRAEASALMIMNGHPVPMSLTVPFEREEGQSTLTVTGADVRMGDDFVTISGDVSGLEKGDPVLKGRADIHHFSLARWFGFGQAMPDGLQRALDSISGSFEDMELSLRGVNVPRLKAKVQDIDLEGSGSCLEFLKPDILISAHAAKADLNRIFPELKGEFPDMSHLPPPVLPLDDDEEEKDDEKNNEPPLVDYDIHISADEADIMNFRVGGADVHVVPAPTGHPMLNILVSDVYGGKGVSRVDIDDDIRVTADLDRVSLNGVSRALAGYSAISGLLKKGSVDLTFAPGDALRMLGSLRGSIRASVEKGNILATKGGKPLPFDSISINAQAAAAPAKNLKKLPSVMDFRGAWNVGITAPDWSVSAEAKQAALGFDTGNGLPVSLRSQPVTLQVTLEKSLLPALVEPLTFTLSGKGSYNADKGTLSVDEGALKHKQFTISGNMALTDLMKKLSARGHLSFSTPSLKNVAALFDMALPATLKKASASADVSLSSEAVSFEKLSGSVDGTSFSGQLRHTLAGRPLLKGSLAVPSLDIDRYLPRTEKSGHASSSPLPLSFLKNQDLDIALTVERLRAFSTTLTHVTLPVSQKNGTLSVPIKAAFPGGGQADGNFQTSLSGNGSTADTSLRVQARNMNMMNFSRDRGQQTLIGGNGTFHADLRSVQKNWEDWKRTLNGSLSLHIADGVIITRSPSRTDPAVQKESRTEFKTMSMNLALSKGIASCRDFLIKGSPITITGEGTADLAAETINASAVVTLAGIPEMPVSITGSLFSPKVTYKLLGAVTGTVGNIGAGVVDIVGGVLSAPFKLFMK